MITEQLTYNIYINLCLARSQEPVIVDTKTKSAPSETKQPKVNIPPVKTQDPATSDNVESPTDDLSTNADVSNNNSSVASAKKIITASRKIFDIFFSFTHKNSLI